MMNEPTRERGHEDADGNVWIGGMRIEGMAEWAARHDLTAADLEMIALAPPEDDDDDDDEDDDE
jgi:hypothetical protein